MVQKERVVHCWVQKMVVVGVKGKMLLRQCGLMLCNIPCQKGLPTQHNKRTLEKYMIIVTCFCRRSSVLLPHSGALMEQ